jgi:protein-L-isoaspartate(D-aspartate) O-methyltransferase
LYGGSIPSEASIAFRILLFRRGTVMVDFAHARRTMVDSQLRTFDVSDLPLLAAMDTVPRERFVLSGWEDLAYSDQELPLGFSADSRLMLSPMVLGRLIQALEIGQGTRVLDVACGFGYSSAVMAQLGANVVALDDDEKLTAAARERLATEAPRVNVVTGPLDQGYPQGGPYAAILVNGSLETRPENLLAQLADRGRLACVVGRGRTGRATLFVRAGEADGSRILFDAAAPALKAFQSEPGFVF